MIRNTEMNAKIAYSKPRASGDDPGIDYGIRIRPR